MDLNTDRVTCDNRMIQEVSSQTDGDKNWFKVAAIACRHADRHTN